MNFFQKIQYKYQVGIFKGQYLPNIGMNITNQSNFGTLLNPIKNQWWYNTYYTYL